MIYQADNACLVALWEDPSCIFNSKMANSLPVVLWRKHRPWLKALS